MRSMYMTLEIGMLVRAVSLAKAIMRRYLFHNELGFFIVYSYIDHHCYIVFMSWRCGIQKWQNH